MTEIQIIRAIVDLMSVNEDDARLRMADLTDLELGHIRSTLKAAHDTVKRELMRRGWDDLTGVRT